MFLICLKSKIEIIFKLLMFINFLICFILLIYNIYAEPQTIGYKKCSKYLEHNNNLCDKHENYKGYVLEAFTVCLLKSPGTINNTLFYNNCDKPKCFDNDFLKYYNTTNYNRLTKDTCIGANVYNS